MTQNILLQTWTTPFGAPPFADIAVDDFRPAFAAALDAHRAEIAAVADSSDAPTFANTIEALERSGKPLRQTSSVFFNLSGTDTTPEIQKIEREMAPIFARHRNEIYMNPALFRRVDDLYARRAGLGLSDEQARILDRYHTIFIRSGAKLEGEEKKRFAETAERLAALSTTFGQNTLADEQAYMLVLETEDDLAGLPDFLISAAARAAEERGLAGKRVITLSRSSIDPFLTFSSRRDLREKAWRAWIGRGEGGGATDNREAAAEMVRLRAERARLLGFETFAHFRLDDAMAKTPQNVRTLLENVWTPARARAGRERDQLQAIIAAEGGNFDLEPWDWRYYAEKQRKAEHDLDEAQIKPYFKLDSMIEAAFHTANRLFGLSFVPVAAPIYHPDVRAWDVSDAQGRHVGLFYGDYFARPSKRSGAWMSGFRSQEKLTGDIRPIIVNVMNFSKGPDGEPALLSFDDAHTLFHEFGHALHGLLSDVTYPMIAGTSVSTDFVELPSQLYEHWLETPEILSRFAVHWRTGEPMPKALLDRVLAAKNFNQGFDTVEYTASALVDLDLHSLSEPQDVDVSAFERASLEKIGMPREIVMRHRLPHFSHIFSGGYSSAYYSYLWSEVLDADAFSAFKETGNAFDPATAERLRTFIYGAGNKRDPAEAYQAFRGKMPGIEPLLEKRGLVEA